MTPMDWYASLEGGREISVRWEEQLDQVQHLWEDGNPEGVVEGSRGLPEEVFAPESLGLGVSERCEM